MFKALFTGLLLFVSATAHAQSVVFAENFESGYSNWTMQGLWNPQSSSETCTLAQTPFPSGGHAVWFGGQNSFGCNVMGIDPNPNYFLRCTQTIQLPATSGTLALRFRSMSDGEPGGVWDQRRAVVTTQVTNPAAKTFLVENSASWIRETCDVTAFAGLPVEVSFFFWIGDETKNLGLGWLIDDVEIVEFPGPALAICPGDGTWRECPCNNIGGPGRGCASSLSATGAEMTAVGTRSVSAADLVLGMNGMSPASATVFQATFSSDGSNVVIAGDGLACVGGSFVRLVTRFAPNGNLDFPGPGDASIVSLGAIAVGNTRYYGARYRDSAVFCTPATYNVTNMVSVVWAP